MDARHRPRRCGPLPADGLHSVDGCRASSVRTTASLLPRPSWRQDAEPGLTDQQSAQSTSATTGRQPSTDCPPSTPRPRSPSAALNRGRHHADKCGGAREPVRAHASACEHNHCDRYSDHDYVPPLRTVYRAVTGGIHTLRYCHVLLLSGSPGSWAFGVLQVGKPGRAPRALLFAICGIPTRCPGA